MNKESYNRLFNREEAKMTEWHYTVSQGKIEMHSYPKRIKFIDDEHFSTSGYGYNIKFDEIQKWRMNSLSSNSYSYRIFLLKDESIDGYVSEINESILRRLNKEINELEASIGAIKNYKGDSR